MSLSKPLTAVLVHLSTILLSAFAQSNPAPQPLPYAQDFTEFEHAGSTYPAGWQGWKIASAPGGFFCTGGPMSDEPLVPSGSASSTSGAVYNYNGKLGFLNVSSADRALVLAIDTTGWNWFRVSYDTMTIRNPYNGSTNTRINELTLQYRVGTSGGWTSLPNIEYRNNTEQQTGSGVTAPQNLQRRSCILPSLCGGQEVVQLRWVSREVSGGGSRPSFAVDNVDIECAEEYINSAPVLTLQPESAQGFAHAEAVTVVSVSDENGDPVSVSVACAGVPGIAERYDAATGRFAWVPGFPGTYRVVFTADDGNGGTDVRTFTVLAASSVAGAFAWDCGRPAPTPSGSTFGLACSELSRGNHIGTITDLLNSTSASSGYAGASGGSNALVTARAGVLIPGADGSAYFETTVSRVSAATCTLAVKGLSFGTRSTATGPRTLSLRCSLDGYAADVAVFAVSNDSKWTLRTAALDVPVADAVTFRLYGHGGEGSVSPSSANWRIDDLSLQVVQRMEPSLLTVH